MAPKPSPFLKESADGNELLPPKPQAGSELPSPDGKGLRSSKSSRLLPLMDSCSLPRYDGFVISASQSLLETK